MAFDSPGQELALKKFGLPPHQTDREEICQLLLEQAGRDPSTQPRDLSMMYVLCMQLFSLRHVQDALLIWRAKRCEFDANCLIDIQLLCGAGFEATMAFLTEQGSSEAREALEYLHKCKKTGDFDDFEVAGRLEQYQRYFRLI